MKTVVKWQTALIIVATLVAVIGSMINVADRVSDLQPPAWCTYPEPAGIKALHDEVDRRVAAMRRHSPTYPIDQPTLEMDAFSDCYPGGTR